jgi:hypothetical protein
MTAIAQASTTWSVEPNPEGGYFVVEHGYQDSLGTVYDMPRGWTYPSRELAEDALPLVRDGNRYPTAADLQGRRVLRSACVRVGDSA